MAIVKVCAHSRWEYVHLISHYHTRLLLIVHDRLLYTKIMAYSHVIIYLICMYIESAYEDETL